MRITGDLRRLGLAGLLLGFSQLTLAQQGTEVRRFELGLTDEKLTAGERLIRVKRGDAVELAWRSNQTVALHVHGYEFKVTVNPGVPEVLRFVAHATGRFPIELHSSSGRHTTLTYLEVYPRE